MIDFLDGAWNNVLNHIIPYPSLKFKTKGQINDDFIKINGGQSEFKNEGFEPPTPGTTNQFKIYFNE